VRADGWPGCGPQFPLSAHREPSTAACRAPAPLQPLDPLWGAFRSFPQAPQVSLGTSTYLPAGRGLHCAESPGMGGSGGPCLSVPLLPSRIQPGRPPATPWLAAAPHTGPLAVLEGGWAPSHPCPVQVSTLCAPCIPGCSEGPPTRSCNAPVSADPWWPWQELRPVSAPSAIALWLMDGHFGGPQRVGHPLLSQGPPEETLLTLVTSLATSLPC
jgi:hypothetical protein